MDWKQYLKGIEYQFMFLFGITIAFKSRRSEIFTNGIISLYGATLKFLRLILCIKKKYKYAFFSGSNILLIYLTFSVKAFFRVSMQRNGSRSNISEGFIDTPDFFLMINSFQSFFLLLYMHIATSFFSLMNILYNSPE